MENLFSVGDQAGPGSEQEYEAKVTAIVETITRLEVDVLGVQEVGSPDALEDVASRLDGDWHHELADPDRRGIRVGFLSQHELDTPQQFDDYAPDLPAVTVDDQGTTTRSLSRPGLRVTVELDGVSVQLVACHFKSKLLSFPHGFAPDDEDQRARYATYALGRRAAEAATTRVLASQLLGGDGQNRALVVLGDLNDTEYSATTTLLAGPGGSEIGTRGFDHPDQGDGMRLWNLGLKLPAEQQFSRTYQGRGELIDHIFVSHALLGGLGEVTTHDVGEGSIGDTPDERDGDRASDHRPVTAELNPSA